MQTAFDEMKKKSADDLKKRQTELESAIKKAEEAERTAAETWQRRFEEAEAKARGVTEAEAKAKAAVAAAAAA